MRFLLSGDSHGDNRWMSWLVLKFAEKHDIRRIIQLGDMGYYPNHAEGKRYIERTENKLAMTERELYFLDGNHENHPLLLDHDLDERGFRQITEHIYHIPRAHRWEWDGVTFLGLGGAFSIDKDYQQVHGDWFVEETVTAEQAYEAKAGGKVDVMFTHDCPWGIDIPNIFPNIWEANEHRRVLRDVVDYTRPELLFHGHYHKEVRGDLDKPYEVDGSLQWHRTRVFGLNRQGDVGSWKVVDFHEPIEDTVVP